MSEDRLLIPQSTANSETDKNLEEIRRDDPKFYMVLDNASWQSGKTAREYVELQETTSLEFLPPYTPQLNP